MNMVRALPVETLHAQRDFWLASLDWMESAGRDPSNVRAALAEAQARRLKKRAAAGTCPCCKRSFSNMATHMRKQHPAYVADNVVKLRA